MEDTTIKEANYALAYARKKHKEWVKDPNKAIAIAVEELGEYAQAINDNAPKLAREELFHVIAVLIRIAEGK